MDIEKRAHHLSERLNYIRDIFDGKHPEDIELLHNRLNEFFRRATEGIQSDPDAELTTLEELFTFMERKLETKIQPMDKVRIVRHPQRICLRDILENVYDNFTEIGGQEEHSIDPSMLIARATITRRRGKKTYNQLIMVIGQEKGHGEEFRNGGSVKPWGNSKALQYMKVAETEGIPIHTYVFTPGSFPIEDTPGAAQQIAKNLYEMAGLTVPMVAVFSEGGSGGAEAISLADRRPHALARLLLGHFPRRRCGHRRPPEARPARHPRAHRALRHPAAHHRRGQPPVRLYRQGHSGTQPRRAPVPLRLLPHLAAGNHPGHRRDRPVRALGHVPRRAAPPHEPRRHQPRRDVYPLAPQPGSRERLVLRRQKKFLRLSRGAYIDRRPFLNKMRNSMRESWGNISARIKYALITKHQRKFAYLMDEMTSEIHLLKRRLTAPFCRIPRDQRPSIEPETVRNLTTLSDWDEESESRKGKWTYISPRAKEDRAITCPNAGTHGCLDLWSPDLYGEFAGVCTWCGHHFPMEYQWFVKNVFDEDSVREFQRRSGSQQPLAV